MHKYGLYLFVIELFDANSSFKFHKQDVWDFEMSVDEGAKGTMNGWRQKLTFYGDRYFANR